MTLRWPLTRLGAMVRRNPVLARLVLRLVPDTVKTVSLATIGPFAYRRRTNRWLWLRGVAETERVPWTMLRALVDADSVVFDCGANIGLYCRYLTGALGCKQVYAFEPDPSNCEMLGLNLRLGCIEGRVVVLPIALADVDGLAEFQLDDVQSASGTLSRASGGEASEGRQNLRLPPLVCSVQARSIDSLIRCGTVPVPDVLKVDVEGAEVLLLRGAAELLRGRGPGLVIELHGAEVARSALQALLKAGYSVVANVEPRLDPSGFCMLDKSAVHSIRGRYDVHFIACSRDSSLLQALLKTLRR